MAKGTIAPTKIVVRIEASRLSSQRRACDGEGKRSSNTDPWRAGSRASVPARKPSRPEDGIAAEWSRRSGQDRSEEHTSELQSLMRISYAVFCLKQKIKRHNKA